MHTTLVFPERADGANGIFKFHGTFNNLLPLLAFNIP